MSPRAGRIAVVDLLRGIAALAVLFNHLTTGLLDYPGGAHLRAVGELGKLGVPVFFVISGFVIPHALTVSRYALGDYGRFLAKRAIRIDLPCYASVAAIVLLGLATGATRFETAPRDITWQQVVLHLGYLNYIFGYQFLNGVLWSLAIEFQYYLFIALVFPVLSSPRARERLFVFGLLGGLAFLADDRQLLFHYDFLFLLGIHTFHRVDGFIDRRAFALGLLPLVAGAILTLGLAITIAGLGTAVAIAAAAEWNAAPGFFGRISYSLYLIHAPVVLRSNGWARDHLPHTAGVEALVLVASGALAVGAGWLLWRLVEQPSQRWSSALRYQAARAPAGAGSPR